MYHLNLLSGVQSPPQPTTASEEGETSHESAMTVRKTYRYVISFDSSILAPPFSDLVQRQKGVRAYYRGCVMCLVFVRSVLGVDLQSLCNSCLP